jgi:predicted acetyltransferase
VNLVLRPLSENDEVAFMTGLSLFSDLDEDWYSFVYKKGMSFKQHLQILDDNFHGRNLASNRVPDSMLYAFLDGEIVGRSSIRHDLNDFLKERGGHIGYSVATNFRKKGITTKILKQSLVYCQQVIGLKKVLITCGENNHGSYKAIEKNGGVLENVVDIPGEIERTKRYWIELT